MTLTRTRADQLISAFPGKRILVLGDMMLDEFIWGRVRRISPEAPVPVVEVARDTYNLGGAGNVAANISALDANPFPVGLVGSDYAAQRLADLLRKSGVEPSGLVSEAGRATTVKTRIVAHNQQIVRADRENKTPLTEERNNALLAAFVLGSRRFRLLQRRCEQAVVVAGVAGRSACRNSRAARSQSSSCGLLPSDHAHHAEPSGG